MRTTYGHFRRGKSFFAYYRTVRDSVQISELRTSCTALVARCGGLIVADATDLGTGSIVDLPGYARLYDALDNARVDAFVTDMARADFGPTLILGLYAVCVVSGVEMWDVNVGRITDAQVKATVDVFNDRFEKSAEDSRLSIHRMLSRPTWLS